MKFFYFCFLLPPFWPPLSAAEVEIKTPWRRAQRKQTQVAPPPPSLSATWIRREIMTMPGIRNHVHLALHFSTTTVLHLAKIARIPFCLPLRSKTWPWCLWLVSLWIRLFLRAFYCGLVVDLVIHGQFFFLQCCPMARMRLGIYDSRIALNRLAWNAEIIRWYRSPAKLGHQQSRLKSARRLSKQYNHVNYLFQF